MKEETWFYRFLKKIGIIKSYEVDKREIYKKSQAAGVCPKSCSSCAWRN